MALANALFVATYLSAWFQVALLAWMLLTGFVLVRLIQAGRVRSPWVIAVYVALYLGLFVMDRETAMGISQAAGSLSTGLVLVGFSSSPFCWGGCGTG